MKFSVDIMKNTLYVPNGLGLLDKNNGSFMQTLKNLKRNRKLDLLLFRGIPEVPDHMYRVEYFNYSEIRDRFKQVAKPRKPQSKSNGKSPKPSKKLVLNLRTNKLKVVRVK